jgi:hypothetical protein
LASDRRAICSHRRVRDWLGCRRVEDTTTHFAGPMSVKGMLTGRCRRLASWESETYDMGD